MDSCNIASQVQLHINTRRINVLFLQNLQSDVETKFNISKCNVLHLGTSQQRTYYLCGTAIQSALSVRDLGVTIDEDLKFHEHTLFVTNN